MSYHFEYTIIILMLRKYIRKKPANENFIDFQDFVKLRLEKQKIINNPFEENWKKTFAFRQLLELYLPHGDHFDPSKTVYNKKQYDDYLKNHVKIEQNQSFWENNQDCQWKKIYKMAEGVNSYEQHFQDKNILNAAKNIEKRYKYHKKEVTQPSNRQQQNKTEKFKRQPSQNKHFSSSNLISFNNLFKDTIGRHQNKYIFQKKEIKRLEKKAVKQYGMNFGKKRQKQKCSMPQKENDYQLYKQRERAIFEKFMSKFKPIPREVSNTNNDNIDDSPNPCVPSNMGRLQQQIRLSVTSPSSPMKTAKNRPQKQYFRIHC